MYLNQNNSKNHQFKTSHFMRKFMEKCRKHNLIVQNARCQEKKVSILYSLLARALENKSQVPFSI